MQCMIIYIFVRAQFVYVCVHTCSSICVFLYVCVCECFYVRIHVRVCVCARVS